MKFAAVTASALLVAAGLAAPAAAAPSQGTVTLIQAVPDARVSVSVDGRSVARGAKVGSVMKALSMSAGDHVVKFSGVPGGAITSKVSVRAGGNSDVVLHRPAAVGGKPVVNSYKTPVSAIGPNKARLLLAHTATVAPADVEFDGKVVFTDIANGEFAEADVPAGGHRVALLPTGQKSDPILGPLDVKLAARTVTMVYAVGNPRTRSMNVIVHTLNLAADGSGLVRSIRTGSAGLASDVPVTPFGPGRDQEHGPAYLPGLALFAAAGVVVVAITAPRRRRRTTVARSGT